MATPLTWPHGKRKEWNGVGIMIKTMAEVLHAAVKCSHVFIDERSGPIAPHVRGRKEDSCTLRVAILCGLCGSWCDLMESDCQKRS